MTSSNSHGKEQVETRSEVYSYQSSILAGRPSFLPAAQIWQEAETQRRLPAALPCPRKHHCYFERGDPHTSISAGRTQPLAAATAKDTADGGGTSKRMSRMFAILRAGGGLCICTWTSSSAWFYGLQSPHRSLPHFLDPWLLCSLGWPHFLLVWGNKGTQRNVLHSASHK